MADISDILYDPKDQNIFDSHKWHISDSGYAVWRGKIDGKNKTIRLHRLINNTPAGMDTDHINRNRLDNRKANLRTVTHKENMQNREQGLGVWFHGQNNNWVVEVKGKHIGCFNDEGLARQIAQMIYDDELPLVKIKECSPFCKRGHNKEEVGTYGNSCKVCVLDNQFRYYRRKQCLAL